MRRIIPVLSALTALGLVPLHAQTPTLPAFEVASIKPHPLRAGAIRRVWTPGFQCDPIRHCGVTGDRFREFAVGMDDLIVDAYDVKKYQVFGIPSWGNSGSDLYDVEAKLPKDVSPTPQVARLMLRSLLADRFQLKIHHETRLLSVDALVLSKNGSKLVANQERCSAVVSAIKNAASARGQHADTSGASDDRTNALLFSWPYYAQSVSLFTRRPVVDETGLDGAGYCTADGQSPVLAIALAMSSQAAPELSLYDALEEKWGMKIEPRKVEMDVIVVDKVERPSAN